MKNTKTRMIIGAIILGIIIVSIVVATILLSTKAEKTKQEEIWEYVFNNDIQSMMQNFFAAEDYNEILKDKKYETTTTINCGKCDIPSKKDLEEHLRSMEIKATSKTDNTSNKSMGSIVLEYSKNQLFKLDYIKDNQSFGIKSDELVDKYLGIKNEKLEEIAKKIGIDAKTDQIKPVVYNDLLPSNQTIQRVKEKLKNALSEQIGTEKFKKQTKRKIEILGNQMNVESYTIVLNDEETYKVLKKILEMLTEDEEIMKELETKNSTLQLLGIEDEFSKDKIQSYMKTIDSKNFSHEQFVMATIYVFDKKMIKLDLDITAEAGKSSKCSIECMGNTMKVTTSKQEGEDSNSIEVELKNENAEQTGEKSISISNTENNKFNNSITIKTVNSEGNLADKDVTDRITVELKNDTDDILVQIKNQIKIVNNIEIEQLNSSNCSFMNEMSKESLNTKLKLIIKDIQELYKTKKNIIISGRLEELTKPVNNAVKTHNAKFEMYKGEFTGDVVVELLNKVLESNEKDQYKISLKTKLTEEDETNLSDTEVVFDRLQPLANLLDKKASYIINIHYQQVSGAIDEISIVKVGLETPEDPPQVVIPEEDNENNQQTENQ